MSVLTNIQLVIVLVPCQNTEHAETPKNKSADDFEVDMRYSVIGYRLTAAANAFRSARNVSHECFFAVDGPVWNHWNVLGYIVEGSKLDVPNFACLLFEGQFWHVCIKKSPVPQYLVREVGELCIGGY